MKNKYILLTIGIPTYNRSRNLGRTLRAIINELSGINESVEILVSDNASSDNTTEVIQKYSLNNSLIRLVSNPENIGFDGNVNNILRNSRGKYVWTLGDSDFIVKGCLKKIINILMRYPDTNYLLLNYNLRFEDNKNVPISLQLNEAITVCNYESFFLHAKVASTFISANIYKRELWDFKKAEKLMGNGYIHILMIPSIIYSGESLIIKDIVVQQEASFYDALCLRTNKKEKMKQFSHKGLMDYPKTFWNFEVNARLRIIMLNELLDKGYPQNSIEVIKHGTLIETLRQAIFIKKFDAQYKLVELLKLMYLTFFVYKNNLLFWTLILPILFFPKLLVKNIVTVLQNIFGSKVRIDSLFSS